MMYSLLVVSCLLFISSAKPADTCGAQEACLDITTRSLENGNRHEVCLTFNSGRGGCNKGDTISHSCPTGKEYEKIEGWRQGDGNKMCKTVDCGKEAQFGIKDGKGCRKSSSMTGLTRPGISDIRCEFDGGYCGGGNNEDCTWTIPAPECPEYTSPPVGCQEDARQCPDGSSVVRVPPECDFADCPPFECPAGSTVTAYSCACPDGSEPVHCVARPCEVNSCPAFPYAVCEDNYCGGCNAIFTDTYGNVLTDEQCNPTTTGACDPDAPCITTLEYDPVCCEDGVTYSNPGKARCKCQFDCERGACVTTTEECDPDAPCIATREFAPVCCEDGETYSNPSSARCKCQFDCTGGACATTAEPTTPAPTCGTDSQDCCDGSKVYRDPYSCKFNECDVLPVQCTINPCTTNNGGCGKYECTPNYCGGCNTDCSGSVCASDVRECSDGSTVSRDVYNGCRFPDCPTPEPTTPAPTTPAPVRDDCDPGINGYVFSDFAEVCNGPYYEPNCGTNMEPYSDYCGCGCRPRCDMPEGGIFLAYKANCNDPYMATCDYGYTRVDDDDCCYCCPGDASGAASIGLQDVEKTVGTHNGLGDMKFLLLNAAVSVATCLLVIALCLSVYFILKKCNATKYKVLNEEDVEDEI